MIQSFKQRVVTKLPFDRFGCPKLQCQFNNSSVVFVNLASKERAFYCQGPCKKKIVCGKFRRQFGSEYVNQSWEFPPKKKMKMATLFLFVLPAKSLIYLLINKMEEDFLKFQEL